MEKITLFYFCILFQNYGMCYIQAIYSCTIEAMSVAWVSESEDSLMMALSATGGQLFLLVPAPEILWAAIESSSSSATM